MIYSYFLVLFLLFRQAVSRMVSGTDIFKLALFGEPLQQPACIGGGNSRLQIEVLQAEVATKRAEPAGNVQSLLVGEVVID